MTRDGERDRDGERTKPDPPFRNTNKEEIEATEKRFWSPADEDAVLSCSYRPLGLLPNCSCNCAGIPSVPPRRSAQFPRARVGQVCVSLAKRIASLEHAMMPKFRPIG